MATVYTDPGAYVQEVLVQGSLSLPPVPLNATLIGIASPNRLVQNEVVTRGLNTITLTFTTSAPYTASITPASDGMVSNTTLLRDGVVIPVANWSFVSDSEIKITGSVYISTSVYVLQYVNPLQVLDPLQNSPVQVVDAVGSFPNVTSFTEGTDYQQTGNDIDWSILTYASLTSVAGPFNLSTNFNLMLSLDGLTPLTVNVQGITPSATTATEVETKINAAFLASPYYGAEYGSIATISSGMVVITSPTDGSAGSVELLQAASNSAHLEVFGIATSALPVTEVGTGQRPALGSQYYVTYEYTRPVTDFNNPMQFFSLASATAIVGAMNTTNPLAIYSQICFQQGAPSIYVVIIQPSGGVYTPTSYINGIAASENGIGMTEIIPMTPNLQVQVAAKNSVTNMSSLTEGYFRRGWFGMATGTVVGDADTPGSYIYASSITFQVPGDSPGRGRMILMAPSSCTVTITTIDGVQLTVPLDGTALAAACAALMTSFTTASTSLLRQTLNGFDTIEQFTNSQRKALASEGVNVVTLQGGNLVLTDPVTTEVAGGGLTEFSEISVGVQKDTVAFEVIAEVNANLVGIVPEDLSDFINDIKTVVGNTIKSLIDSQDIGPFTNSNGTPRDIDFATDIIAAQSPTDETQFTFGYYFNARYPAKRFFGQFSVDNPFFAPSANATAG